MNTRFYPDYCQLLGRALEQILAQDTISWVTTVNTFNSNFSRFDSETNIEFHLSSYLEHIHRTTQCPESCFIIAMIYIKRMLNRRPEFILSKRNLKNNVSNVVRSISKKKHTVHQ